MPQTNDQTILHFPLQCHFWAKGVLQAVGEKRDRCQCALLNSNIVTTHIRVPVNRAGFPGVSRLRRFEWLTSVSQAHINISCIFTLPNLGASSLISPTTLSSAWHIHWDSVNGCGSPVEARPLGIFSFLCIQRTALS